MQKHHNPPATALQRFLLALLPRFIKPARYKHVGAWAEAYALAYLRVHGLRWLDSNYLCRGGELDIVMQDGGVLVFVEVRYRQSGGALESISPAKFRHIQHCAQQYRNRHPRWAHYSWRFDLVTLEGDPATAELCWHRSIFE